METLYCDLTTMAEYAVTEIEKRQVPPAKLQGPKTVQYDPESL